MDISNFVVDAINKCKEANGLSDRALADKLGVSQAAVSSWLNGTAKTIRPENWARLLPLVSRYLPAPPTIGRPPPEFTPVPMREFPLVSLAAAADHNPTIMPVADFLAEYAEDKIMFPEGIGRDGDFAIQIVGDSMLPWYPDGTSVLVRPARPQSGDRVIAVLGDGSVVFKIFIDKPKSYLLVSINEENGCKLRIRKNDFGALRSIYRVIGSFRDEAKIDAAMKAAGRRHSWERYLEDDDDEDNLPKVQS